MTTSEVFSDTKSQHSHTGIHIIKNRTIKGTQKQQVCEFVKDVNIDNNSYLQNTILASSDD